MDLTHRAKKRKAFADVDASQYEAECTRKCSLSSLLPRERDVRPFLSDAIVYCNRLRVYDGFYAQEA